MKISLLFLSGGKGLRMNKSIPKQYLLLHKRPIALHSYLFFTSLDLFQEIIVVAEETYHSLFFSTPNTLFAPPGKTRQESLFSGFERLTKPCDIVCIHDAARPFVDLKDFTALLEAAKKRKAATLGSPVTATIKEAKNSLVTKTIPRENLFEIHTPQAISYSLLQEAIAHAKKESIEVTDDVSLVERLGHPVEIVISSKMNIKITTPFDLRLAEALYATL